MNTCASCHWWFRKSVCVFHTGMKGAPRAKVSFGGSKPLETKADFGCVDWRLNERKQPEEKQ